MDRFGFEAMNDRLLEESVKIKNKGDSTFEDGKIVSSEQFDEEAARIEEAEGQTTNVHDATTRTGQGCVAGHHQGRRAIRELYLCRSRSRKRRRCLTEAALAGKVDGLVGLKENVILGHLVPREPASESSRTAKSESRLRRKKRWSIRLW